MTLCVLFCVVCSYRNRKKGDGLKRSNSESGFGAVTSLLSDSVAKFGVDGRDRLVIRPGHVRWNVLLRNRAGTSQDRKERAV